MLTWPVTAVGWITSIVQRAEASQKRINEFLQQKPEVVNTNKFPFKIKGKIAFKEVTFTYDDTNITALKKVNFLVKEGETLAILGNTGSGKSTIAELIVRLYDTTQGEVMIDGVNIKDVNLNDLRKNIGIVPQEAFLFSDTVKDNIKFGYKQATDVEIESAAKEVYIHHNIVNFSKGYKTEVGERGITLSGGQKQRISIARAIIKNPKILIFDDCLSAVDTETEEIILQNLKKVTHKKTTIIIGHRISSTKNADKIMVLEKGKIIQYGTYNELINAEGYYKKLYEQQLTQS